MTAAELGRIIADDPALCEIVREVVAADPEPEPEPEPAPEKPRCRVHSWLEEPYGDGAPAGATFHRCRVCRLEYDEIEAEIHDLGVMIESLTADVNAETERADALAETAESYRVAASTWETAAHDWERSSNDWRKTAELNAAMARLNAETIASAQRAHAEELEAIRADLRKERLERSALRAVVRELASIVVDTRDHGARTLWTLYEHEEMRRELCRCRREECEGCAPSDAELRYEHDAEVER